MSQADPVSTPMPRSGPPLASLAGKPFVSLTTFRRSGAPASVPVWVAAGEDGSLVVTTVDGSGKVRRIAHDARVVLRPCSRRGRVAPGAPAVSGTAEIVRDALEVQRLRRPIVEKYGLQVRLITALEKLLRRRRQNPSRVILRISEPADTGSSAA